MSLETKLLRWERRLWDAGLRGYIIRRFFRLAWIRIRFIPGDECLWRAVNKPDQVYKDTGRPKPAFFRDKSGLSVDLSRLSSPERSRVGHGAKPYPTESGLVEIRVSMVRDAGTDVNHVPVREPRLNYAHAQFTSLLGSSGLQALAQAAHYRIQPRFTTSSSRRLDG